MKELPLDSPIAVEARAQNLIARQKARAKLEALKAELPAEAPWLGRVSADDKERATKALVGMLEQLDVDVLAEAKGGVV